ncbi:hypothetical protein GDO78_005599, partial [Eleutherodactylus coqui]
MKLQLLISAAALLLWHFLDYSTGFPTTSTCGNRPLVAYDPGSRIVGGKDALPGSWPWIVSIQEPLGDDIFAHLCGATLLNTQWVLTAAHCLHETAHVDTWRLVFGANKLSVLTPEMQIRGISKVIEHEAYYNEKLSNDVALLALDRPITYNNYIQPACLPQKTVDIKRMTDCFIAGWGLLEQNAYESSDTLQEARVQQISTKLCNSTFWYNGLVGIYNLCAGNEKGGVDACQGDSGGPLMCRDEDTYKYYVTGVTSWGSGCAQSQKPGVYTNTQYFLKWIQQKLAAVVPSPIPKEENILPTWKIVPSNRKPQPNPFTKKPVKPTRQPPCHSHPKRIMS